MPTRNEIVAEAMTWKGTPWAHQGRLKSVGVDCAGIVLGVGLTCGCLPHDGSADIKGYGRQPDPIKMKGALDRLFLRVPKDERLPGDIPWMRSVDHAQHLGILTFRNTLIQAVNYRDVEEAPIESMLETRIVAIYRYKGLEDE
jgi:cell wall-associated NlpC family hydrolase